MGIAAHIDQSHRGNITFWAVSWWGPTSPEDVTLREQILKHPRAGEMRYAIHYETPGRLGKIGSPDFAPLIRDFRHLAREYFNNPNYFKINSRPVVFIYLTREYFKTPASHEVIAELRKTMKQEFNVDPYLVGDDLFGPVDPKRAVLWDAIDDYDVYGTVLQRFGSTTAAIERLNKVYSDARAAVRPLNIGFIPTATPGFNDRGVRSGHPAAPRYLTDVTGSKEGSLFETMIDKAVLPNLDERAGGIMMVTSFNEWHEDTQIEPTGIAGPTTRDSSGGTLTQGVTYPGYGDRYLEILAKLKAP